MGNKVDNGQWLGRVKEVAFSDCAGKEPGEEEKVRTAMTKRQKE